MRVAELKLVVEANAVEMREGFAEMRTEMRDGFARVDREFASMREEMDDFRKEVRESTEETRRLMQVYFEDRVHKAATILEVELQDKFDRRYVRRR